MYKKIALIVIIVLFIVGLFVVIKREKEKFLPGNYNGLKVTASFYPLYFFASQIGGNKAYVYNITPSGGEPHDYEPSAQDMETIETSKLLIINGGGLEAWGEDMKKNLDPKKTIIVTAGEGLTDQMVNENGIDKVDPHVWLSPPLAKKMVDNITKGFVEADPMNAQYYTDNASALKEKLVALDNSYKTGLVSCAQKNIVTSHAAFGYLATAYHLNQVSIAGLSPDAEPSPKQLIDIAAFIKKNNIKYIFFESLVSPKLSDTLAGETGAKTMVLDPIEGLSKDELAAGETYLTEMENNLINLKIALQCKQ